MNKIRQIFFVVASGGHGTDKHYYDTIERKRTVEEAAKFLNPQEIEILKIIIMEDHLRFGVQFLDLETCGRGKLWSLEIMY